MIVSDYMIHFMVVDNGDTSV